jgi:hypothetical protein
MSHLNSTTRISTAMATAALVLLLACLGLAACGGSSKSSSTSANAASTTSGGAAGTSTGPSGEGTTGHGAAGQGPTRFKALRECLQKNGITPPKPVPGQRGPGGRGGFLGGGTGLKLPNGVTRAQYEAAFKKCGGGAFAGRGGARIKSPAFEQALTKFAACMREHGVNVPTPNTSGNGPIFDTKGLNTSSAQFRAAEAKCSSDLRSTFRRGGGAGGATPPTAAPPTGAASGGPAAG